MTARLYSYGPVAGAVGDAATVECSVPALPGRSGSSAPPPDHARRSGSAVSRNWTARSARPTRTSAQTSAPDCSSGRASSRSRRRRSPRARACATRGDLIRGIRPVRASPDRRAFGPALFTRVRYPNAWSTRARLGVGRAHLNPAVDRKEQEIIERMEKLLDEIEQRLPEVPPCERHDQRPGARPRFEISPPFTNRELHLIKQIAGVRAGELFDAMEVGDNDLVVALAHIAVKRAGRTGRPSTRCGTWPPARSNYRPRRNARNGGPPTTPAPSGRTRMAARRRPRSRLADRVRAVVQRQPRGTCRTCTRTKLQMDEQIAEMRQKG